MRISVFSPLRATTWNIVCTSIWHCVPPSTNFQVIRTVAAFEIENPMQCRAGDMDVHFRITFRFWHIPHGIATLIQIGFELYPLRSHASTNSGVRVRALSNRECTAHELTLNGIMCRCALIENVTKTLAKNSNKKVKWTMTAATPSDAFQLECSSLDSLSLTPDPKVVQTSLPWHHCIAIRCIVPQTRENRTKIFTRRESSVFYKTADIN